MSRKSGLRPITILLRQLQSAIRRATEEAMRDAGLTAVQANVLTEIAYGPGLSNAELARRNFVSAQTMLEILLSLEDKALIVREATPRGGRAMLAELTDEGRTKVFAVHLTMREVEGRMLRSLAADDVKRMRRLLEECLKSLGPGEPAESGS